MNAQSPIPGPGIFRTRLPQGFLAGGVNCGVRRYRPDLGLILSQQDCTTTAVFTKNSYQSVHIQYCKTILPSSKIRAIITNSGQANAATGDEGMLNNARIVEELATSLGCDKDSVLVASTGVIGQQLAIENILRAIPELTDNVSNIAEKFATAILTTDLVPKTVSKTIELSGGQVHITGICKGSGMIHPNMATMLAYFLSDVSLTAEQSEQLLRSSCHKSFNMISVDGETSTNDSAFCMTNGASGVAITSNSDLEIFQNAMDEIAILLAKSIVQDGEGATKLFETTIRNCYEQDLARQLARSLSQSPLVKTAMHGSSPNWGRILSRIGAEGVPREIIEACSIFIQDICVFAQNKPCVIAQHELDQAMRDDHISVVIDFHSGSEEATAWGCDMSKKYISINAEYLT